MNRIDRRLCLTAVLLTLLGGAWLRLEAATPSSLALWRQATVPLQAAPLPDDFDRSAERAASAIAAVWVDIDDDGDSDVVGLDSALALLIWENDGAGRLTLKQPSGDPELSCDGADSAVDSPSAADESSDQSDAPSAGLPRRCEPHVSPYSRALTTDRSAPLRSPTRSSQSPRAPPVQFNIV